MTSRSHLGGLVVAAVLAGVCGSGAASSASWVEVASDSATVHFGSGRETVTFLMHEPAGVILLYRISSPRGANIRATAQLPGVTVPLEIATTPLGPASSCPERGGRVTCTVGQEGCPMPEATWRFRVEKRAGPAGDVTLWFRVGDPPGR